MSGSFTRAVRENVGLIVAISGGTGSGKTFSALTLAAGMCGDEPFAVIDTERGRALHYADQFKFDCAGLDAPFNPHRYQEKIVEADRAGYKVILVDSMSHEHAGEGGILDMQEAEFQRLGGRESAKMLSWAAPKKEHKRMMQSLLQAKAHIILCFRAEEKVEMVKNEKTGKTEVVPKKTRTGIEGWVPVCEKNIPFEATCSFLMTSEAPGVPRPIKLQEQHRHIFPEGLAVTRAHGAALRKWAEGGIPASRPSLEKLTTLLQATGSLAELADFWGTLTADEKKALATVKDTQKTALTAAQGGA